jgi:hypothetical protein
MRWTVICAFVCALPLWSCGKNPVNSGAGEPITGPTFSISLFDLRLSTDGESFQVYDCRLPPYDGKESFGRLRIDPVFDAW